MPWQDITRILDAQGALEEALHQVTPRAEDDNDQS